MKMNYCCKILIRKIFNQEINQEYIYKKSRIQKINQEYKKIIQEYKIKFFHFIF